MMFILSTSGVASVYSFVPSLVTPPLNKISNKASGAIDSVTKGSENFLNPSEIPLTKPTDNCCSVSIPSCTDLSSVLNGCSKKS